MEQPTNLISKGVADCVIILTANRMGYNPAYVDLADKAIRHGGDLEPIMIGVFSSEATKIHNQIAQDKRHEEANQIAMMILSEYGY